MSVLSEVLAANAAYGSTTMRRASATARPSLAHTSAIDGTPLIG